MRTLSSRFWLPRGSVGVEQMADIGAITGMMDGGDEWSSKPLDGKEEPDWSKPSVAGIAGTTV